MKHSTKRRCASFLILIMLVFSIVTVFTGCTEGDSTKDVYQSDIKVKDQTPEFYINDTEIFFLMNKRLRYKSEQLLLMKITMAYS